MFQVHLYRSLGVLDVPPRSICNNSTQSPLFLDNSHRIWFVVDYIFYKVEVKGFSLEEHNKVAQLVLQVLLCFQARMLYQNTVCV